MVKIVVDLTTAAEEFVVAVADLLDVLDELDVIPLEVEVVLKKAPASIAGRRLKSSNTRLRVARAMSEEGGDRQRERRGFQMKDTPLECCGQECECCRVSGRSYVFYVDKSNG